LYLIDNNPDQVVSKWMADIVIYNMLGKGNTKFRSLTNVSIDMTRGDVLGYYMLNLKSDLDTEELRRNYYRLEAEYRFKGEKAVWEKCLYIDHYVENELKHKHGLYGEYLEKQTISKIADVVTKLDLSKWDYKKYPSVWGLIVPAFGFNIKHKDEKEDNLQSDIATNKEEGKDFTVNIREVHNTKGSLQDLYHCDKFYSKTMEDVYWASKQLFTDDSRGRSNLDILYFSIFNKMMLEDAKEVEKSIIHLFPRLGIDVKARHPIKYEYKKNGGQKWGHLPHIDKEYKTQEPGNESIINTIMEDGNRVLSSINKIMSSDRLMKQNISVYFAQVCGELLDNFTIGVDTNGNRIIENSLRNKLNPRSIQYLIKGIHSASKVKEVIEESGRRFMCFPAVELRQKTWNRFSNYHELMTYHHIHEDLGNIIKRSYSYNIGESNVGSNRLFKEKVEGIPEEILILEEVSKHSLNLKFTPREPTNRKNIMLDTGEGKLYNNVINQLIDLNSDVSEPLRYLKNNPQLSCLIGFVIDLTMLSLVFFRDVPENYRVRENMRKDKLNIPDSTKLIEIINNINNRKKLIDDDIFRCEVFTQEILGNVSLPRKVLKLVEEAHNYAYEQLNEVFQEQGLGYVLNRFNGEYGRANLNGVLNIYLGDRIQSITNKVLRVVLSLGGQGVENGSIVKVDNYTEVIAGVVDLIRIDEVETIMRCDTVEEFVRINLFKNIQEKFGIQGKDLKAYKVILQNITNVNKDSYNKLRDILITYFDFNTKLNLNDDSLEMITTIPFERDMRILSNRFDTYAYTNKSYEKEIQYYNLLEAYALNSQMSLLSVDGVIYITEDEVRGGHWVYSSLGLKTKYPATNNDIEQMNEFDIDRFLKLINDTQEE